MKNILLIFLKNGTFQIFFLNSKDLLNINKYIESLPFQHDYISKDNPVVKYFLLSNDQLPHKEYLSTIYLDINGQISYKKQEVIKIKLDLMREKRNQMLEELDIPFQKALQRRDIVEQEKISNKMEYLRNIPQNFKPELFDKSEDIIKYDPFTV